MLLWLKLLYNDRIKLQGTRALQSNFWQSAAPRRFNLFDFISPQW
jgi:hypothetical protein